MSMKVAWLTPWNGRSAIASFSAHIVAELRRRGHDVRIFRTEVGEALELPPLPDEGQVEVLEETYPPNLRMRFDHVVANIGNHFPFHGALPRALDVVPALGIFHDGFLAHFAAAWSRSWADTDEAPLMLAEALYGAASVAAGPFWLPLDQMAAERPMLEWMSGMVAGAFTHSQHWVPQLDTSCAGEVTVHPLSMPDDRMPPPRPWGKRIAIATIGHINSNKQADQVLRAIASQEALRDRCDYHLLGNIDAEEQARLTGLARSLGIAAPAFTGWLEDAELRRRVEAIDVICCLRYPVLEAGSASLITAMRSGRPVLVSDHGLYATLPQEVVLRCRAGEEASDIARHVRELMDAPALAAELGARARTYATAANAAASYADALLPAMEAATAAGPRLALARGFGRQLGELGLAADDPQIVRLTSQIARMLGK
jgi:glycosyltransferase involved in cell wall biosynthesis